MSQNEQIQLISGLFLLFMLVGALVVRRRYPSFVLVKYGIYWVFIILFIIFLYSYKEGVQDVYTRIYGQIVPSELIEQDGYLTVRKSADGHFYVKAMVNKRPVLFLIDTGATQVVLNRADAISSGINIEDLIFDRQAQTAGGKVNLASTQVDIKLGPLDVTSFGVAVSDADMGISLLGMSFLKKFDEIKVDGDVLYLKQ